MSEVKIIIQKKGKNKITPQEIEMAGQMASDMYEHDQSPVIYITVPE